MKRLFRTAFFMCGFIGLLLNLAFILALFNHTIELGSELETALEAFWIGGVTFFGLGTLVIEDQ